jgi:hypothetical protein
MMTTSLSQGGQLKWCLQLVHVHVAKPFAVLCAALRCAAPRRAVPCCAVLQVGVLLPLVRLLMVGDSQTQRAAALLVGQFAAPPLEAGALIVGLGEPRNCHHQPFLVFLQAEYPAAYCCDNTHQ